MGKGISAVLGTAVAACALAAPAGAAVFPVTNTNDAGPDSLRAALLAANSNGQTETDQIPISATGVINLQSALPTVDGPATITGPGPANLIVRRSSGSYRVFGIVVTQPTNTVRIERLKIADGLMGVELAGAGRVVLDDVLVSANVHTGVFGGGVVAGNIVDSPSVSIIDSTIRGNQALDGAGVHVSGGSLEVINSTITGNHAAGNGGGINVNGLSPVTVVSSTIAGNTADDDNTGGGDGGGTYNMTTAPTGFRVANTLFAGNTVGTSQLNPNTQCAGPAYVSLGYNLRTASDPACSGFAGAGDIVNPNPIVGPLSANGGPTETIPLLPGSPAIDAGNPAAPGSGFPACEATDQRGLPRGGVNGRCDIGAFEFGTSPLPPGMGSAGASPGKKKCKRKKKGKRAQAAKKRRCKKKEKKQH